MLGVGNRGELNIVLRVKDDGSVVVQKFGQESEKGFSRAKSAADGVNRSVSNLQRSLITAISTVATFAVGGRLIDDFKKSEQAVAALDASLISMGRTTPELSAKLQALASQIQRNGIIDDDAIVKGQSFLTTYGAITDDLLPRTTQLMADLAAKMGGDTVQAANLLGKASLGMVGELARIGITLSDATKESKDFQAILGEIEAQVGGMNAALGATSTGGITQFANQWGNVREQLGQVLALSLSPYLRELSQGMDISNESAQSWAASIRGAIESIVIGIAQVVDIIDEPVLAVGEYSGRLWDQYTSLPGFAQELGLVGALLLGTKGRVAVIAALAALDQLDLSKFDGVVTDDQFVQGSEAQLRQRLAEVDAQLDIWREEQSRAWFDWHNALPSPTAIMPSQEELEQLKLQLVAQLNAVADGINGLPPLPNLADALLGAGDQGDTSAEDRVRGFFDRVNAATEAARAQAAENAAQLAAGGSRNLIGGSIDPADDEVGKFRVQLAEQLIALDESFLSEREALENQYLEKQFLLDESLDLDAQSHEAYYERRNALDLWYAGEQQKIAAEEQKRVKAGERLIQGMKMDTFAMIAGLLRALPGQSKAAAIAIFAIEKGLAIANTIMHTAEAVMAAEAIDPTGALAIKVGILGKVQLGIIAATGLLEASQLGGGGGGDPSGFHGGSPVSDASSGANASPREQTSPTASQGPRELRIIIDMGSKQFVRDVLIPELIEAESDGVGIVRVIA